MELVLVLLLHSLHGQCMAATRCMLHLMTTALEACLTSDCIVCQVVQACVVVLGPLLPIVGAGLVAR